MLTKVFIDLCAGLGGASQAFWDSPEWLVIRIDNNADLLPLTPGLTLLDITDLNEVMTVCSAILAGHGLDWDKIEKLVVWASPPCQEFSNAYDAIGPRRIRNGEEHVPSFELVDACMAIIARLAPDQWYIENVHGAIPYFQCRLGAPRQKVGSFFLWGRHPLVDFHNPTHRYIKKMDKRHSPMRSQILAKVPMEISQAILDSLVLQTTMDMYFD